MYFLSLRECLGLNRPQRYLEATITRTTVWVDNQILSASALSALALVNADISGSAAIAATKISGTAATLAGPNIFTGANVQTINTYTPGAGGTATLDLSKGGFHFITMPAGNITIALSNPTTGQPFLIRILQDSGGSRTVTWFSTIRWAGGSAPTLTTTASKADEFGFITTGTGTYDAVIVGQNI